MTTPTPPAPKPKTAEQVAAWFVYKSSVRQAQDMGSLLKHTEEYAKVDKGQASFAYNRAKKALEDLGYLRDPKWTKKGFGAMGIKMRSEFFESFKVINSDTLPLMKDALLNEDTHRLKSRKRYRHSEPCLPELPAAHFIPTLPEEISSMPKPKKIKKTSDKSAPGDMDNLASATAALTAVAAAAPEVQAEAAKSIKSTRLADAMNHASFQLLSKAQQQAVRDEWISLLS